MAGPAPVDAIDVVVPPYMSGTAVLAALDGVATQLVQSQSIGFDGVADALPPGHVFANAVSVHETSTAELALALILASQRGLPDFVRAAGEGTWAPARHASLADRTVLLVGYGGVGKAIEERLRGFETTVVRVASRARDGENGHVHGIDELAALLPQADIVVVGVPLGENTRHLIDDRFLSLMEDGSLLVNISRGAVADTGALLEHARRGRLRLALDVTDPEPLPDGHPLFALPNVLITPHVGGASSAMMPRMARLLHRQVKALLRGEDPENVVLRS
ncbi:2-hydroxyacid dehydrogenase [Arthrobacter sp. SDTb3-6]|nr:2-hydroxyacid dehydrogenase [Arthrobacter sp. SDTb3-6]